MSDATKVVVQFRPYVPHRPTRMMPKGFRTHAHQRIESFVSQLAYENGGKVETQQPLPPEYEEVNGRIYYIPSKVGMRGEVRDVTGEVEREVDVTTNLEVLRGKIFVDWVNLKVIVNSDLLFFGINFGEMYAKGKMPRVKRMPKLEVVKTIHERNGFVWEYADTECKNPISPQDKHSHACAFCGKVWGYRSNAERCSYEHIKSGEIEGDHFNYGIESITKEENI